MMGGMNKLRLGLVLIAVALAAGAVRLLLGDAHSDGLVLAILGTGAPGLWIVAAHIDGRSHAE